MWTASLVLVGVTAQWLAAKHWWGWALNAASELLWFAYALHTNDHALMVMACVWGSVAVRNAVIVRRASRAHVPQLVPEPPA